MSTPTSIVLPFIQEILFTSPKIHVNHSNSKGTISLVADDGGEAVLDPIPTALEDSEKVFDVVKSVSLKAWPNPFNPAVTIAYNLTPKTNAVYNIYNLKGQILYSATLKGGLSGVSGHLLWQGKNRKGKLVPSGFFIGRLVTNRGEVLSHKLLLLK